MLRVIEYFAVSLCPSRSFVTDLGVFLCDTTGMRFYVCFSVRFLLFYGFYIDLNKLS